MRILITGGNGFIGKALRDFLSLSHDITIIDSMFDENYNGKQFIGNLSKTCEWLNDEIKYTDLIIHLASPVGIFKIDKNSNTFLEEMLKINLNIFSLVKKYNKKIIYSSTSEVYKNTTNASEYDDLTIGSPDKLRWGYAAGKLTSEFLCKSLCDKNIILRFFNVTGIGDNKGVMYKFIKSIKNNEDINIFGNGDQIRTFCDIRDVVKFTNNIIQENIYKGDIYNVGNRNNVISLNDLAKLCLKQAKSKVNINYTKYEDIFSNNYDDIIERVPNCKKMNQLMKSQFTNADIIKSMLNEK